MTESMTKARVLTFHIDTDELPGLTRALDDVAEIYGHNKDFRGLVCLEHDSARHQIVVITLWDGEGLEDTEAESEIGRERVAATTDLAVSSVCYEVLRLVPGPASLEAAIVEAFAS